MIFREILDRQLSNDSLVQRNFIINIYVRHDRAYINRYYTSCKITARRITTIYPKRTKNLVAILL